MNIPTSANDSLNGRGAVVLVVDDDDVTRHFVSQVLSRSGYQVIACRDGRSAVETHRDQPGIAVVLTDMIMPNFDGMATARAIRELDPAAKIAGTSGYPPDHFSAVDLTAFLPKPHTARELLSLLRRVLDS